MLNPKFLASFLMLVAFAIPGVAQDHTTQHADYYRGVQTETPTVVAAARFTPVQPKQDANTSQLSLPVTNTRALDNLLPSHPSAQSILQASTQSAAGAETLDAPANENAASAEQTEVAAYSQSGFDPYFDSANGMQGMGQVQSVPTRWTPRTNSIFQGHQHDEWRGFCPCCPLDQLRRHGCSGTADGCGCDSGCGGQPCRGGCKSHLGCGHVGGKLGHKRCECKERRSSRRQCRQACRDQSTDCDCVDCGNAGSN